MRRRSFLGLGQSGEYLWYTPSLVQFSSNIRQQWPTLQVIAVWICASSVLDGFIPQVVHYVAKTKWEEFWLAFPLLFLFFLLLSASSRLSLCRSCQFSFCLTHSSFTYDWSRGHNCIAVLIPWNFPYQYVKLREGDMDLSCGVVYVPELTISRNDI